MIQGVFGLPRSGKTTLLSALALKALNNKPLRVGFCYFGRIKNCEAVYTNFPLKGCRQLNFNDLGKYDFHDCLILIDEISLLCDSRNFKTFSEDLKYFFSVHCSHANVFLIWCSQSYMDTDIKIRRITTDYYMIEKINFLDLTKISPINQFFNVSEDSIHEGYRLGGLFSIGLLNRRKYYKHFDSYTVKKLPPVDIKMW